MSTIKKILIFSILTFGLINCKTDKQFDSNRWKDKGLDWQMTDVRESMIYDLIDSDTLAQLSKTKLIQLLGEPAYIKNHKFSYLIREKYDWDIDPTYTTYLVVEIDSTEKVVNYYIK